MKASTREEAGLVEIDGGWAMLDEKVMERGMGVALVARNR